MFDSQPYSKMRPASMFRLATGFA